VDEGRRLAFSTLGCPGDPVERIIDIARDASAGAVELRCCAGEPVFPDCDRATLHGVRSRLASAGLAVACLAGYAEVGGRVDPLPALRWQVVAARELGAPYVRVFGSADGGPDARDLAIARLRTAAAAIDGTDVTILLETHDAFPTGAAVADILGEVGSAQVGAIWDVVNPWRNGEEPQETLTALGPWLRHVQLKDVSSPSDLTPVLPGAGAIPIRRVLGLLDDVGYDGWLSLEWERAWYPSIPPLPVALARLTAVLDSAAAASAPSRTGATSRTLNQV